MLTRQENMVEAENHMFSYLLDTDIFDWFN